MGRTFVMCKPDAVERKLVGEITRRLEESGLSIIAAELRTLTPELLSRHYEEHVGKPFYDELVAFMSRSPAMLMVLEGEGEAFAVARQLMGATDPVEAESGTIRGDLGTEMPENLIHGSDSEESAKREISIFFPEL
ncbi:MAG: nucleoside-diphosphate kinase [Actinobacteria bacterium]|nr:nucleoside-diphosphate kinase [Actinomycetota bacterium]MEC7810476.1 nucleoside-diphosphate kinase [Actinomycetota bacterium]MED5276505.1 nucleoside-diphosphate kinase [Actinomycetota bacterium]|tara:strand:- start:539 stop:946 length:408 start_codon:yes stop_codon:yes gene_type:complete